MKTIKPTYRCNKCKGLFKHGYELVESAKDGFICHECNEGKHPSKKGKQFNRGSY